MSSFLDRRRKVLNFAECLVSINQRECPLVDFSSSSEISTNHLTSQENLGGWTCSPKVAKNLKFWGRSFLLTCSHTLIDPWFIHLKQSFPKDFQLSFSKHFLDKRGLPIEKKWQYLSKSAIIVWLSGSQTAVRDALMRVSRWWVSKSERRRCKMESGKNKNAGAPKGTNVLRTSQVKESRSVVVHLKLFSAIPIFKTNMTTNSKIFRSVYFRFLIDFRYSYE